MNQGRRKHRVVVEITMDEPCTAKHAASTVQMMLDDLERQRSAGWPVAMGVTKAKAKEYARVKRADK